MSTPNPPPEPTGDSTPTPPPLPPITIRKAKLCDISSISTVSRDAFYDDALFATFIPNHKGTNKLYKYMYYRNLARMLNPRLAVVVAECEGRVVGYVSFERYGDGPGGEEILGYKKGGWGYIGHPVLQKMEAKLLELQTRTFGTLPKGMNKEAMEKFAACERLSAREHYPPYKERWHTQMLAVDPKYGRRGIGKRLISTAIEWAEKEGNGCVVTLEASVQGAGLYRKLGFKQIGQWDMPTDGTPVMVYIPDEHKKQDQQQPAQNGGTEPNKREE